MSRAISLEPRANLGGGWFASFVQFAEAVPLIVLVTLESEHDATRQVRLDLGKGMFVDSPPDGIDRASAAREVTKQIARTIEPAPAVD
jgi:hypothetical protein